jgi:FkbM family methyltransferase
MFASRRSSFLLSILLVMMTIGCAGDRGDRSSADVDEILISGEKLYSQFDEELIIRHFFADRRGGVFLDVGCGPATRNSTTYYLERHLGWSGIGVDGLPDWEPEYETGRLATRYFNYIVTDHSGTVETFHRVLRGKMRSSVDEPRSHSGKTVRNEQIEVPTITLNELLDREGVKKIDFLSMDIEGSAPPALAGFDIERFRPELVCIEVGKNAEYGQALFDYFERHGYERIDRYLENDDVNWYFTPRP